MLHRVTTAVRGCPNLDCRQKLLSFFATAAQLVGKLRIDRGRFERVQSLVDQNSASVFGHHHLFKSICAMMQYFFRRIDLIFVFGSLRLHGVTFEQTTRQLSLLPGTQRSLRSVAETVREQILSAVAIYLALERSFGPTTTENGVTTVYVGGWIPTACCLDLMIIRTCQTLLASTCSTALTKDRKVLST